MPRPEEMTSVPQGTYERAGGPGLAAALQLVLYARLSQWEQD